MTLEPGNPPTSFGFRFDSFTLGKLAIGGEDRHQKALPNPRFTGAERILDSPAAFLGTRFGFEMRLDQWLWAVRLYKSRSLAVTAIRAGHVRAKGQIAKPARTVQTGETITVQQENLLRTFRVLGAPESRVGAPRVPEFAEDLTPPEDYLRARDEARQKSLIRPAGAGRPTKRDRRAMESFSRFLNPE